MYPLGAHTPALTQQGSPLNLQVIGFLRSECEAMKSIKGKSINNLSNNFDVIHETRVPVFHHGMKT